jgi:hypothetical protein
MSFCSGASSTELAAEITGSTLFQIIGGAAPAALAAPANGLALMAMSEWCCSSNDRAEISTQFVRLQLPEHCFTYCQCEASWALLLHCGVISTVLHPILSMPYTGVRWRSFSLLQPSRLCLATNHESPQLASCFTFYLQV